LRLTCSVKVSRSRTCDLRWTADIERHQDDEEDGQGDRKEASSALARGTRQARQEPRESSRPKGRNPQRREEIDKKDDGEEGETVGPLKGAEGETVR
jgi:hypothetical protein